MSIEELRKYIDHQIDYYRNVESFGDYSQGYDVGSLDAFETIRNLLPVESEIKYES